MRIEVLSLGGSLIVPDEVNYKFLRNFKTLISKFRDRKFVIVAGGGITARKYIRGFKNLGFSVKDMGLAGVNVNRLNAWFIGKLFDKMSSEKIPNSMSDIKNLLRKKRVVILGVLRFEIGHTSDSTAAEIAKYFHTRFINMTNVEGLFNKDPKKFRNAKLVRYITFKKFSIITNKMRYHPGQHFVLDQSGARIIMKYKIPTYVIGPSLRNLENILKGKRFVGTTIYG